MTRGKGKRAPPKKKDSGSAAPSGESRWPLPLERQASVIAQDPSILRGKSGKILMARVSLPAEDLEAGPVGYRFQVVDYDASTKTYVGTHVVPESYDDEPRAWREGSPSIVHDPRFRAYNTYVVAMKTLARFEFALGRRIPWGFKNHQLKLAPTGIADANAFYAPDLEALVFGYLEDEDGSPIYTCLTHDIVVHETAHALLDGLRERYLYPSTKDQAAFHEGFSDLVALLSVFAQREIVQEMLTQNAKGSGSVALKDIDEGFLASNSLLTLAEQFGRATTLHRGNSLRASANLTPEMVKAAHEEFEEPHRRGEILVAAMLHAFIAIWKARVKANVVAGQSSVAVAHLADEGSSIAEILVTLWIRAIDYLPPSDVDFSEALTAALTADFEVRPDDSRYQIRDQLRRHCRAFGIRPAKQTTTEDPEPGLWVPVRDDLSYDRVRLDALRSDKDEVFHFLWENRDALHLETDGFTQVLSVHPCVRVGVDGFTLRETVATYYQVARVTAGEAKKRDIRIPKGLVREMLKKEESARGEQQAEGQDRDAPTLALYGGGTLIFSEAGRLKYHIWSPVFGAKQEERIRHLFEIGALSVANGDVKVRAQSERDLHRMRAGLGDADRREEW